MKRFPALLLSSLLLSSAAQAQDSFKVCWSIYAGWMPWAYGAESGIVKKWADKYDIAIDVVQINDYIESINQYTVGEFDACTMTNMDALTIPAAGGVDSTALIVGDFSNGNDGIVLKGESELAAIKGQNVNLVELSVSHYLLARALDSVGLSEADVQVVNTSDADMVAVYGTDDVTSVATWNPLLSEISQQPNSTVVFDSAQIPGEVIDLLVINTDTLSAHPELGKALTGAWYEIMATMSSDSEQGVAARSYMAEASGTDLDGYEAQLAATKMFYTPAAALELTNSAQLKQTMQYVAEFSFDHGLLGDGAPDAGFIGVQMPAGDYGDSGNLKLRFDPTYMQMAADGQL
ncbi:putative urea ABC transporter substrate-binding protein [Halopseudomonas aestusnigri]|jgi:NitT/TauT family transport system substrate-binding protein|uniref:putative urea ABC transporter substrate-binding protein n=1 Tax=Halopseudomonas aestusnigri TaxID=857252 RepID=UPI000C904B75|nr:putative urea ABC transporter substrate-binding protein [Halopseudomonas aestusnigri]MAP77730.1 lipid kinase [Pseudomonadales bacterium]UGV31292.1 putative urea ABC transporter substrate-binding protein [Halopseudomonas aestusnigri]|tara:strand:+ start:5447 stop:6490 length:1044 start_codon:yes stop_codon:yes gene_type:complete